MASKNFGQMKASVVSWAREPVPDDITTDALNDGIERIWNRVIEAQIASFVGGPVTLSLASASERTQLVSVADPTTPANVGQTPGGTLGPRAVYGAYSYVTESGSETKVSPSTLQITGANNVLEQFSPNFPINTTGLVGWNCYMSTAPETLALQNDAPIPFGQPFVEPESGAVEYPNGVGIPSENTTADDIFYIKLLEVPLTAGGYKRWDQVSIDSSLFAWANRSLAANSEFQPYYYDLINGRTLEYRPALGQTFPSARYFFIHKPRRIKYDTASIPFYTFSWEQALRSYALSAWCKTQSEWEAAQGWESDGDKALEQTLINLRQQDWNKNTRITPYFAGR